MSDEREDGRRREGGRRARVILARDRAPVGRLIARGTHSLRRCSSMHPWQKRWRQGETTLTFFRVPQQMAHRVSARTDPSLTDILAEIELWPEVGEKCVHDREQSRRVPPPLCFCGTEIQSEQESI